MIDRFTKYKRFNAKTKESKTSTLWFTKNEFFSQLKKNIAIKNKQKKTFNLIIDEGDFLNLDANYFLASAFSSVFAGALYLSFNALMISFVISNLSSAYKIEAASPVPYIYA